MPLIIDLVVEFTISLKTDILAISNSPIFGHNEKDGMSLIATKAASIPSMPPEKQNLKIEASGDVKTGDHQFIPIRAAHLIAGIKSFFDIYVCLKPGKYLKLL